MAILCDGYVSPALKDILVEGTRERPGEEGGSNLSSSAAWVSHFTSQFPHLRIITVSTSQSSCEDQNKIVCVP